jgi:nucleotide-binding universal stress UspA family protein
MPKIILVGVDGSESSRKAAKVAAELAASTGATLHVLTAVDPRSHGGQVEPGRPLSDIPALTPGEAAEAIAADVAASLGAVVPHVESNRRVQGIGRLLGSVATDVAQHAPCDVYVVKTV